MGIDYEYYEYNFIQKTNIFKQVKTVKKFILPIAIGIAFATNAQTFEVVSLEQVNTGVREAAYHPRFMPDGNTLLVCDENYDGLGLVDIKAKSYTHLTNHPGAGYEAVIGNDGKTIISRKVDHENQLVTLCKVDLAEKTVSPIVTNAEHFNNVRLVNGEIAISQKGKLLKSRITKAKLKGVSINTVEDVFVTVEDLKLVVYKNGVRNVVDPLYNGSNDPSYTWASLSPNGKKLLFVCGNDAYVTALDGSNIVCLGMLHAPVWRGNDYVVGMEDYDDGHIITDSNIVIIGANGKNKQVLTTDSKALNMFPAVSADGSKIVYNTGDGKIFMMTIKGK